MILTAKFCNEGVMNRCVFAFGLHYKLKNQFETSQQPLVMMMKRCAMLLSGVVLLLLLHGSVWATLCHREEHFRKLEGSFPPDAPLKITTTSALTFCSIECLEFLGCQSFAFLTTVNTDNCHLGPTNDGLATPSPAEVYKLRSYKETIRGCASSPCKNGGTCEDLCDEPYHLCRCPANAQGDDCEWNIDQFPVDWTLAFDDGGTHTCTGNAFLAGFKRSEGSALNNIEEAVCGPLSIEYSEASLTCQNAWWWDSFGDNAWSNCPYGHLLRGFYRSSGTQILGHLEEGVCCKPLESPTTHWASCYYEEIGLSFNEAWATARCQHPLHFIHGIRTSQCEDISCIEELYCCKMA